jgi:hypothetical protein
MAVFSFQTIISLLIITVTCRILDVAEVVASSSQHNTAIIDTDTYLAVDDATWAVMNNKLSRPIRQKEYNEFMDACRKSAGSQASTLCDRDENYRMQMNMYQPRSVCQLAKSSVEWHMLGLQQYASFKL